MPDIPTFDQSGIPTFISVLKLICNFFVCLYPFEELGCCLYMNNLKIIFLWMTVE